MPLRGAAIGPDAVLVWTGTRELTRFDRAGTRTSFTIPIVPLAAHIDARGLRIVDACGTLHRYTLAGQHAGAVPLTAPATATAAAIAEARDRIALLAGDAIAVFEDGASFPWPYAHPHDGYREVGVDLSADGEHLLVAYETFAYFSGHGSVGSRGAGVHVYDRAGSRAIELSDWGAIRDATACLSADARHIICDEAGRYVYAVGPDGTDWSITHSSPLQLAVHGPHVAVLLDRELVIVELATRRRASLEIPERFTDLVLTADNIVLLHADLGAWWIPLSTLMFEADT